MYSLPQSYNQTSKCKRCISSNAYVRVANGGFTENDRPKGGNYLDGYRTTGYFFAWLKEHKDPDFLRKLNKSTLEVIPWSFEGGVKYALGKDADINKLWHEYQVAMGDLQE